MTEKNLNQTTVQLQVLDPNLKQKAQLQGQCKISHIHPLLRHSCCKLFTFVSGFLILTLVLPGLLALRYSKKLRAWLMYSDCPYEDATHVMIVGNDAIVEIEDVFVDDSRKKVFMYRKIKYSREGDGYYPVALTAKDQKGLFDAGFLGRGLTTAQVLEHRNLYGKCQHKVHIPGYFQYMGGQLVKPFFILQYVVCISFILQLNFMFAGIMIGMSLITTTINYIMLRLSFVKIKEIAEHSVEIRVVRDGQKQTINSTELVPGDIFEPDEVIPCDCVLLKGEIYVNQASLTGENIPIGKFPPANQEKLKEDSCWLFEGAKVLEARGEPVLMVLHTGFITRKGRIFRKILNNNPGLPEFFASGVKFLGIMFVSAYAIYFGFLKFMLDRNFSTNMIFYRALDMIGWSVPAALPIYFNLCYSLSLNRLRQHKIFGTQPQKTVVSGKVKTMCFDKTGTLTQNSMQLYSIHRILSQDSLQDLIASDIPSKDQNDLLYKFFASCHTVRKIKDQFMGDQLDLRMYLFSGFTFELSDDVSVKFIAKKNDVVIHILRINQFESKFQCMSVLVKDVKKNKYYVFVKGAAEKMQRSSVNKYDKYEELISSLSLAGLRNIAFGYKEVQQSELQFYLVAMREEFEKGLTLLGVVAFENKLKPDTVETIKILMDAKIEPKIITGDNIFIAVETALRTNILPHGSKIILLEGRKQKSLPDKYNGIVLTHDRVRSSFEDITLTLEEYRNQTLPMGIDNDFLHLDPPPSLPLTIKLFARISPESKAEIVRKLKYQQQLKDKNHKVGMCGDGANDLMAIKEADCGMGISDTDSSFAANFSIPQLKGVQEVIRDGKATLTSIIEVFIYYGVVSYLKATSSFILLYDNTYFSQNQIVFFNYASTLFIALFLALSGPAELLTSQTPNDNFMSMQNVLKYVGNIIIPTAGLIICQYFTTIQPFYSPMPNKAVYGPYDWYFKNLSNTTVFVCIELMLICSIYGIYVGSPYKKLICCNPVLTVLLVADIIVCTALFFITGTGFGERLGMVPISVEFGGQLLGITLATVVVTIVYTILVRVCFRQRDRSTDRREITNHP